MEIKRVTEDFSDRSRISWTPDEIKYTMDTIETLFEDCDAELANAGMSSLGYEKQDIGTVIEHMVILVCYVYDAHSQCHCELDKPLFEAFKNGATSTLSNIVLDDITTENTFGMQEYVEVPGKLGSRYMAEVKADLTMSDFLGLEEVTPGSGMPALGNVETLGWFTNLFRADYQNMAGSIESVDQMLEIYLYSGEYSHEEYHPVGNFISGLLDITVVKPFIESITGTDMITGEKLTDFERGMQLVNAIVGAVTLGQGALALDLTGMAGKEIAVELLKMWAVDAISDTAAYTVGYACDELGMPAGVSFIASLLTGCTVSVKSGKYILQDADRNVVKELDADGMKALLKEGDIDLEDLVGGGKKAVGQVADVDVDIPKSTIGKQKASLEESLTELAEEELAGIKKVDNKQSLDALGYADGKGIKAVKGEGGIKASITDVDAPKSTAGKPKVTKNKNLSGTTPKEVPEVEKVNNSQAVNKVSYNEEVPIKNLKDEGGSVPDFYVGPNGKALPSQYKDWIGTNIQKELLDQAENPQLQNAIKQLYRGNSFIGDGGTADIIRFEKQTGLMLGKNGGSHVQKGIDMAKYIENKILTQDLSPSDRALATQLLEDLYSALGR